MNRRSFLSNILKAGVSAMILPTAATYTRQWTKPKVESLLYVPNPAYIETPYEMTFLIGANAFKSLEIGPPPTKQVETITYKRGTGSLYEKENTDIFPIRLTGEGIPVPAYIQSIS